MYYLSNYWGSYRKVRTVCYKNSIYYILQYKEVLLYYAQFLRASTIPHTQLCSEKSQSVQDKQAGDNKQKI